MKKLIILLLIFLMGCGVTIYNIDPINEYFGIDFTKYSKEGFLFTPEKYLGEYESIGMIEYKLISGAKYLSTGRQWDAKTAKSIPTRYKWFIDEIEFSQAVDSIYFMAKSMGANTIMNFDFNIETNEKYNNPMKCNNPITIYGYRITGFAIKRLD